MEVVPGQEFDLPLDVGDAEVSAVAFHPDKPVAYVAAGEHLFAYDLYSGALSGRGRVNPGSRIHALVSSPDYLVAATEDGCLYVYEGDFLVAGTVGPLCPAAVFAGLKGERVPFAALALSPLMPWLFFARGDSKEIHVIDLGTKQKLSFKMDAKKPVTALACDPGQSQLAAASSDGVVRVWDYTRQRIHFQTDDFNTISLAKKIPLSRISALEFFQQQIVAVGQNGVVVLWNLSLKEASKVSAGCRIMRHMLPVVGAAAHHALPCLLTLSANGTLFSWKLTTHPDKKISIHPGGYTQDFNAVVTETERRVDYVSSFGDRSDAPQLEATGLVAHQSLNYLAFTFNKSPKPDGVPSLQVGTRVCFYSLMPRSNPAMLLPQAERVEVQSDFFHEERFTFDFPVDRFHFVDRNKVQSHSLLDGNNMLEDELPTVPEDVGTTLHPTRFLYSPILRQFLVFSELYDTIALNKDEDSSFDSISNVREQKKSLLSLKLKEGKANSSGSVAGDENGPEDPDSKDATNNNKKERHHHAKEKKKLMAKFQVRTYAHLPAASVSQRTKYRYWLSADHNSSEGKNAPRVLQKGRDGVFIGSHHLEYVVISESGEKLHVASTNAPTSSKASHKLKLDLPRPMLRVFKTPLASERAVLYFDPTDSKVVYSLNVATGSTEITAFLPSPERRHSLKLYRGEVPIDVLWKPQAASSHTHLAAVVTTHFIRLFSSDLRGNIREIFKYEKPYKAGPAYFQSGYWLGSSFLFSTPTGISYLTIEGIVRPLCSLDVAGAVITAVMNDRIFYACPYHDRTQIRSQPVGLLEPLLMGQLSMAPFLRLSPHHLRPLIARIVGRFDCRRVSQFLLEELDRRGLPDLAFALAENSILLDDIYKYELAVRSLSFHKAINLLYKAYKNSPEYPALPESSELRGRFVHLAEVAVDFQQYEIARRCYEVLNDYYALLHIYAICRDVDGLKSLTVSDIQDAPVGLAELAQMLIVVEAQNAEKPAGVSNATFTSLYTTSHWNALQATHPIMRVGQGPECEMVTVAPLKPEGVQDWLGKKLDWNPAFIPSSQRPAPPPPLTLASDHSSLDDHRSGAAGGRRASVVNVPDKGGYLMLVPPSRKLHIPKVALPYCDSTTPTLRRTLSDENVRRMTHYATKSAGDASGTTSDGDTLDQDDVDSTEFSGTSEIPSSTNVDDTFSPMTDNTEDDEEDTETETVRDVDMDDEERERAEKEGAKPGEGEKQENETPAESNEETLATISSERNKITNAREGMRRMLLLMDLGRFNSAFDHADLSIRLLRKDAEERRREIKFCASYKLALSLLLKIKQLQRLAREGTPSSSSSSSSLSSVVASTAKLLRDKNPASGLALISRHLTEVRLDPRHGALLLSLVVGIQMDLGNFNYAAGLVRRLLAAQLEAAADDASADRAALLEKLRECEERGGRGGAGGDAVPIPYKCVRCGHIHAGKVPGSHCDKCRAPIRFCHSSYELIGRSHFYACRLCEATYAHDTPKCSLCLSASSPLSPRRVTTPAQ